MSAQPTHAVIVCESMFGNTRAIADQIADVLWERFDRVEVVGAADASSDMAGVDLLVVGAPTHAFGLSRPSTRADARKQGAVATTGRGVREWLAELRQPEAPTPAAAFDTRIPKPFTGSAAKGISRRLRRLGFDVVDSTSFGVQGTTGPLVAGETERARCWAVMLPRPDRRTAAGR